MILAPRRPRLRVRSRLFSGCFFLFSEMYKINKVLDLDLLISVLVLWGWANSELHEHASSSVVSDIALMSLYMHYGNS